MLFIIAVALGAENAQLMNYVVEMLVIFSASSLACWLAAFFFLPEPS